MVGWADGVCGSQIGSSALFIYLTNGLSLEDGSQTPVNVSGRRAPSTHLRLSPLPPPPPWRT